MFIIDRRDNISRQTDVVIYDAMNCPVYRASEDAAIYPADNVAAVVEVKSHLDGERLREAAENIRAAKSLAKTKQPDMPFLVQAQTLGCVFSFDSVGLETLEGHYVDVLKEGGLGHHIDLMLVLDRAVLSLAAKPKGHDWSTAFFEAPGGRAAEGSHLAVATLPLGEASLDGFLRILLAHLTFFRGIVDHPGFGFPGAQMRLRYLTSLTNEKDPKKREAVLKRYGDEVREEFSRRRPVPPKDDRS